MKRRSARVIEALGVTANPVTRFGEWLARRAADENIDVSFPKTCSIKDLLARSFVNVVADDGPGPVRLDGFAAIAVKVDGNGSLEAGCLEAVVQPTGPRVEAYCAASVPVPRSPGRTPPLSSYGSQRK